MAREALSTDALMAEYHGSFVKCWNDQFSVVVMVPVSNVKCVTWNADTRAIVWLKEPVPLGLNDSASVLHLFYESSTTVGMLPPAGT